MQGLFKRFDTVMRAAGITYLVTCTARTYQEQVALYAQGRQPLEEVNKMRSHAGLPPILAIENKKKVTWTLASKHIVNWEDADASNDKSRAFDIVIVKDGKPTWDIKADVNRNNTPDFKEAGVLGEAVGLVWGGRFSTPDYCHFEEPKK
jgi:peptidoglycan L-alanyl-D-glutamate endopeptidase CwlK